MSSVFPEVYILGKMKLHHTVNHDDYEMCSFYNRWKVSHLSQCFNWLLFCPVWMSVTNLTPRMENGGEIME